MNNQKEALEKGKIIKGKEIKELYAKGFTTGEIAKKVNTSEHVVVRILGLDK